MVTYSTINKQMLAGGATVGLVGLFAFLFLLTGVKFISSGDVVCNGLTCEAFVTVNTSSKICFEYSNNSNYLYKKPYSTTVWVNLNKISNIVSTNPNITVDWYVKKAKTGSLSKNWTIIYDGYCWSGKNNLNKLVGHATQPAYYKWSFVVSKVSVDPLWASWSYTFTNKTVEREVITYKNVTETSIDSTPVYKNVTLTNICSIDQSKNVSMHCYDCTINKTVLKCYDYIISQIDHYDIKNVTIIKVVEEKSIVSEVVSDTSKLKTGVIIGNKTIINPNINIFNNTLNEMSVPVGDRNWIEYPFRQYEIDKGVSKLTSLDKIAFGVTNEV